MGREDYATVAYNAATGAQLWVKRYNGPANGDDNASSVALSPNGTRVFVTGHSAGPASRPDYATVAYNAATGAQLWVKRYNGPGNSDDEASSVALSPNGSRVFVTGTSASVNSGPEYATVAYSAASGTQLWVRRYKGPGARPSFAGSVVASRDGAKVFVTGTSATVAYHAGTGAQLWLRSDGAFIGVGGGSTPPPTVVVSRDGAKVFVAGTARGVISGEDYATVAYSAATGARLWTSRYNGPANGDDTARSVVVSPSGRTVFVNGISEGAGSGPDYATVAYRV
ncbi:MAG TPA: PQQ-binding-like beta-propeller repeat protein [Acidimicrobiales bacterium]|nr:PQQ-binding-like beta-propeller repeat protein [Acidimicrobiales bacterium]